MQLLGCTRTLSTERQVVHRAEILQVIFCSFIPIRIQWAIMQCIQCTGTSLFILTTHCWGYNVYLLVCITGFIYIKFIYVSLYKRVDAS